MRTKIDSKWLSKNTCCEDKQELKLTNKTRDVKTICNWLFDRSRTQDACWIIVKCLGVKQIKLIKQYLFYCAKKILPKYKKTLPGKAHIAKECIKAIDRYSVNPTEKNMRILINIPKLFNPVYNDLVCLFLYNNINDALNAIYMSLKFIDDRKSQKQIINYGLRLLYKDKQ